MNLEALTRTDLRHHLFTVTHSDLFPLLNLHTFNWKYEQVILLNHWSEGRTCPIAHLCVGLCFSPHVDAIIWGQHSLSSPT